MSVGTAFHPRTAELNTKMAWGEWAGYWSAPVYHDFHDIEYNAIREAVAIFDTSPLYKFTISGPDAARLLDRMITRDVGKLGVGRVLYTPWCSEDGKVIDDGNLARLAEDRFLLTTADQTLRWLRMNGAGLDVQVEDVSEDLAALAVQGPLSRDVLERATGQDWKDLRYFGHRRSEIAGVQIDVTRTGFTGDLGYELWVPGDGAVEVWDAVWEAGQDYRIRPIGIRALDIARVEAGLIMVDAEYTSARHATSTAPDEFYSPFEIGFGRLVDFGKENFVGKRALDLEQSAGGPRRRLVGLHVDWTGIEQMFAKHGLAPAVSPVVDRSPVPLYRQGRRIGRATSITWGITIKKMVAFGSVPPSMSAIGARMQVEWTVEGERGKVPATVVELPFLDLPRKRA
ncbi:MAG TPA: aminomethyltransferase family protein [Candidatus Limnocylindrales bacterium]|nr:aminomethyltransferase family protein [Candidatus Limnocylindrales bacterium]